MDVVWLGIACIFFAWFGRQTTGEAQVFCNIAAIVLGIGALLNLKLKGD